MRGWVPASTIAIAAVLAGTTFGAIRATPDTGDDPFAMAVTLFAITLYGGVILLLPLAMLAFVYRRVGLRAESVQWRTVLDLGADRDQIVRGETIDGLRRGAIASGAGTLVGLVTAMVTPYFQPSDGTLPFPSLWALVAQLIAFAVLVGVTGLVHLAAARSATKPGPRPGVATGLEPEESDSEGRVRLSRRMRFLVVVFAVSAAALAADRFLTIRPASPTTGPQVWLENAFTAMSLVVTLGGMVLLAHAIAWATRRLASVLGHLLARVTAHRPGGVGLAARIAADGLTHRSSLRSLATGAIGGVLAIATLATVTAAVDSAELEITSKFQMTYSVATTAWWNDLDSTDGAVQQAIDPAVVDALLADERVAAIPYGVILGETWETEYWGEDDTLIESGTSRESVLVVDPSDLEALTADGLRPLGFQDGVATTTLSTSPWDDGSGDASDAPFTLSNAGSIPFVARDWAEASFGTVPVVGVLLWAAGAESPVQADGSVAFEGPTADQEALLDQAVADAGGASLEHYVLADRGGTVSYSSGFVGLLTTLGIPLTLLGIGLIVSLANASVKDRRRELATMSALGASPRALRVAPALEVACTVLAACVVGIPVGAAVGVALSHPTLFGAGAPLDPANTLWIARWELAQASFTAPLLLALVTLAVSIVAALIASFRMAQGTPVEELRTADKEGVR